MEGILHDKSFQVNNASGMSIDRNIFPMTTGKRIIPAVSHGNSMKKYQWLIFPVSALAILFLLTISPGCLTNPPSEKNLTGDELANQYLQHANAIKDYRSEYVERGGTAENTFITRFRFDYKTPSFARMEVIESHFMTPGTFVTTNGTLTTYYDADTGTYGTSSEPNLLGEYDYQAMVHQIVTDRNFTILGHDSQQKNIRYLIEVATDPWSTTYTPYVSSRIRAWIEPSTGLAWNISSYYDCDVVSVPTPTPPPYGPFAQETCSRSDLPNKVIEYQSIDVNTGIPDSHFNFVPPEGSGPRCVPKYVNYVEPPLTDTSVPIDKPLPEGVRYSLNESDSGRTITLQTGEVIEITLDIIPGLAMQWIMPTEGASLELMNAGPIIYHMPETGEYTPPQYRMRGYYRWRFRAIRPGIETFDGIFSLGGCDIGEAERFNLTVQVTDSG